MNAYSPGGLVPVHEGRLGYSGGTRLVPLPLPIAGSRSALRTFERCATHQRTDTLRRCDRAVANESAMLTALIHLSC